jgi:hypothetical protein
MSRKPALFIIDSMLSKLIQGASPCFSISPWEDDPTELGTGLVTPDCPIIFCYENNVHRLRPLESNVIMTRCIGNGEGVQTAMTPLRFRLLDRTRRTLISNLIKYSPLCLMTYSILSIQFSNPLRSSSTVTLSNRSVSASTTSSA